MAVNESFGARQRATQPVTKQKSKGAKVTSGNNYAKPYQKQNFTKQKQRILKLKAAISINITLLFHYYDFNEKVNTLCGKIIPKITVKNFFKPYYYCFFAP